MKRTVPFLLVLAVHAACGGDDAVSDAGPIDAPTPGGTFSMSWSLADPDGLELECGDVAGASVRVTALPINGVAGFAESFSCATGTGTSGQQPAGNYSLTVDLRTSEGDSLLAAPVALPAIEITSGGNVAAGEAAFEIEPIGSVSFRLDAAGDGNNCGLVDDGNGGLIGVIFELADGAGTCLDGVDLVIAAGGGESGTYTTNCATPALFDGCIENDQDIAISNQVSGPRSLTVTGNKEGPIACYSRLSAFTVPGNSLTGVLGSLPLALEATIECDPSLPDAGPP